MELFQSIPSLYQKCPITHPLVHQGAGGWDLQINKTTKQLKKLENFGGHLLSEDDHSYWAPPYWNITKETFSLGITNSKSNCKSYQLRVLGMFIKKKNHLIFQIIPAFLTDPFENPRIKENWQMRGGGIFSFRCFVNPIPVPLGGRNQIQYPPAILAVKSNSYRIYGILIAEHTMFSIL